MHLLSKIAFILLLLPLVGIGQDEPVATGPLNEKLNARFVIKVDAGIPKPITSQLFRKSFNGFYDASVSFNLRTVGNFYFGIGYENIFFKCNAIIRQQISTNTAVTVPYDTRILADAPFVVLSYDKYFKPGSYASFGLNYGYIIGRFTSVIEDTSGANLPSVPKGFSAQFIKPEASLNFTDKENQWISFKVSIAYTTVILNYDPKAPRLNQFGFEDPYTRKKYSNKYYMSWITFGFGLNFLLGRT